MRSNVHWIAVAAALGGLLFGFGIAVINGAIVFLRTQLRFSDLQTEVAVSSLLLGCVFGASLARTLSDRFGRKGILLWSAALFLVSSIGAALPCPATWWSSRRPAYWAASPLAWNPCFRRYTWRKSLPPASAGA